jgi:hypothetical protein
MLGLALPEGRFTLAEINTLLAIYEAATLRFLIHEKDELMKLANEIVRLAEKAPVERDILMKELMDYYQPGK